jgi:hypothetical protein
MKATVKPTAVKMDINTSGIKNINKKQIKVAYPQIVSPRNVERLWLCFKIME